MSLSYVKHDRDIAPYIKEQYGKFATHDIHFTSIIFVSDKEPVISKEGDQYIFDNKEIEDIYYSTIKRLKKNKSSFFSKFKSWLQGDLENVKEIPVLKGHDKTKAPIGYIKGFPYLEEIQDNGYKKITLKGIAIILDPETKQEIANGQWHGMSAGIRSDKSIREISLVHTPALPEAGGQFAEVRNFALENIIPKIEDNKFINELENIKLLQIQADEIKNKFIPNHQMISKLIKNGLFQPWQADDLLKEDPKYLEFVDKYATKNPIGSLNGFGIEFAKFSKNHMEDIVANVRGKVKSLNQSIPNINSKANNKKDDLHTFNEYAKDILLKRNKELNHIRQLLDYSSETAKSYIDIELGNNIDEKVSTFKEHEVLEYYNELSKIEEQIAKLNSVIYKEDRNVA